MKKHTTISLPIAILIATSVILTSIVVIYKLIENSVANRVDDITSNPATESGEMNWPEITADGVNEELLLQNVDQNLLEQIAYELQTLVAEASEEEREDPEIVIREGWTRIWQYERYQKILNLGAPAMKPLYLIIYKSPHAGEYEYLCANILYELSGFDFEWTNSKEFLEKFNQAVLSGRK